jgi:molecular chaperone GrpE
LTSKQGRPAPSIETPPTEPDDRPAVADEPRPEIVADGAEAPADAAPPAEAGPEEATDYKDRWLRAVADLQNFRRRGLRDHEEARRIAEERVMLEMIAALDDLERALEAARESGAPDSWTEGVRLVVQRIGEYLARQGVTKLDPLGQPFDPQLHEAMLEIEAPDAEPGHVVQVAQSGYRRGDRALRAARVVVAGRPNRDER